MGLPLFSGESRKTCTRGHLARLHEAERQRASIAMVLALLPIAPGVRIGYNGCVEGRQACLAVGRSTMRVVRAKGFC